MPPIKGFSSIAPGAPRKSGGLAHPLAEFGIAGKFVPGLFADIVLHFINAAVLEEPDSERYKGAAWFLPQSKRTYFYVCGEAGIDAARPRDHLNSCAHRLERFDRRVASMISGVAELWWRGGLIWRRCDTSP